LKLPLNRVSLIYRATPHLYQPHFSLVQPMSGFQANSTRLKAGDYEWSATQEEEQAKTMRMLPCFDLKVSEQLQAWHNYANVNYLTCFSRQTQAKGTKLPMGMMLLAVGLVKQETEDSKFVCGVTLYEEMHDQCDSAIVDIHKEALRLMCGEESIAILETHMRIGTMAWIYTGGNPPDKDPSTPMLHRIVRTLPLPRKDRSRFCSTPTCGKEATMGCPTCKELGIRSRFCSQACFKGYWKTHKAVHSAAKEQARTTPAPTAPTAPTAAPSSGSRINPPAAGPPSSAPPSMEGLSYRSFAVTYNPALHGPRPSLQERARVGWKAGEQIFADEFDLMTAKRQN
jgi:hypothetical protein